MPLIDPKNGQGELTTSESYIHTHTNRYTYIYIHIHLHTSIHTHTDTHRYTCLISWGCRIHQLHLCNSVIPLPNEFSR